MRGRSVFLELVRGSDRVTLRLFRDEEGVARAFARGGGYAVEHVERAVPAGCERALEALARALERGEREPAWAPRLLPRLRAAVDRADPAARLVARRVLLDAQPVPAWPAGMRSGAPSGAGALWPYDAELTALKLGVRRLVRREWGAAEDDARARDAERLSARGLRLDVHRREGGRVVVLAARDRAVLEQARAHEARVESDAPGWEDATRAMGEALGYPACCVETFVTARARGDAMLMAQMLPDVRHAPLPPETLWVNGALALVSHVPCTPRCEATAALAGRVRDALDAAHPGFAARWRELAARVHLLTPQGRALAVRAAGSLEEGRLAAHDLVEIALAGGRPEILRPLGARSLELVLDGLWLGAPDEPGVHATLFADHRG